MEWVVSPAVNPDFFFKKESIYIIMFIIKPTLTVAGFNTQIYLDFLITSKTIQF